MPDSPYDLLAFVFAILAFLCVALMAALGRVARLERQVTELRRARAREEGRRAARVRRSSVRPLRAVPGGGRRGR